MYDDNNNSHEKQVKNSSNMKSELVFLCIGSKILATVK